MSGIETIKSVAVYCGSSNAAAPPWLADARRLGEIIAGEGIRLVYGGGGVGLMGACAAGARAKGGDVLGVIPGFLTFVEAPPAGAQTVVVESMHERKIRMFEEADGIAILPGAIGTLEEAVEILSWRRLGLHHKPMIFYNPDGFWDRLFALFHQFVDASLLPASFNDCWRAVTTIDAVLPEMRALKAAETPHGFLR
jgi:uncharacterized protein (TIGR00730 family)